MSWAVSPGALPLTYPLGTASRKARSGLGVPLTGQTDLLVFKKCRVQCTWLTAGIEQVTEGPPGCCILSHSVHLSQPQTWLPLWQAVCAAAANGRAHQAAAGHPGHTVAVAASLGSVLLGPGPGDSAVCCFWNSENLTCRSPQLWQ